jgi:hypothetical protein
MERWKRGNYQRALYRMTPVTTPNGLHIQPTYGSVRDAVRSLGNCFVLGPAMGYGVNMV